MLLAFQGRELSSRKKLKSTYFHAQDLSRHVRSSKTLKVK